MEPARISLGIEATPTPMRSASDIEVAVAEIARQSGGGLVLIPDVFNAQHLGLIIELASRYHLPAIYGHYMGARLGGLMSYSVDAGDLMHSAADYVDRILRGSNPTDLPVQLPARFMLIINLKTAKALGFEIAPTFLLRADELIE
jgi:putative ABC transport system substrate-binding protein